MEKEIVQMYHDQQKLVEALEHLGDRHNRTDEGLLLQQMKEIEDVTDQRLRYFY